MHYWAQFPFLRFLGIFILGIVSSFSLKIPFNIIIIIIATLFTGYISLLFYNFQGFRRARGLIFLIIIYFIGFVRVFQSDHLNRPFHLIYSPKPKYYLAQILSTNMRDNYVKYEVDILSIRLYNTWKLSYGKINLYHRSREILFNYGDMVIVEGSPAKISAPLNPSEFNYQKFLKNIQIHHQHFVDSNHIVLAKKNQKFSIKSLVNKIRFDFQNILDSHIKGEDENAVAKAILLGDRRDMEKELVNLYSDVGAIHILAVSGLHVGIQYMIWLFLLGRLRRKKWGNWLFCILCNVWLWGYALVTGLSPSVVRAVTMFSLMLIAKSVRRQNNIYNTLALSAFILLFIDPFLIKNVGFQLSYLAVIGIIWLQPKIYQSIIVNNIIIDKIWVLESVSLAAQITTFPVTVHYFHQFPSYFWLANIIAIPLAFAIVVLGVLLLSIHHWSILANIVSWLLENIIWLLHGLFYSIKELPFSMVQDISISRSQVIIFFLMVYFSCAMIHFKTFIYVILLTICIWAISANSFYSLNKWYSSNQIIFYHIKGASAIEFACNGSSKLWTNSLRSIDFRYHINPHIIHRRQELIKSEIIFEEINGIKFFSFLGKKILIIDEKSTINRIPQIDILIFNKKINFNLTNLEMPQSTELVVVDGSLNSYQHHILIEKLKELNIPYHCTRHQGALIVNL